MDKIAEYGIASHWSYKEKKDGSVKDVMEQKLQIFRSIIEYNDESTTNEEFVDSIKKDLLTNDVIYVYTPRWARIVILSTAYLDKIRQTQLVMLDILNKIIIMLNLH